MYRVLLVVLLTFAATAQTKVPNLSGTWKLDRDKTTADLSRDKTTQLVVSQTQEDVRFDYYENDHLLGSDVFVPDGKERKRYETRVERAVSKARWHKGALLVTTWVYLDPQGYQSYTITDRWEVSPDGKTLTDKTSDGKKIVYQRAPEEKRRTS